MAEDSPASPPHEGYPNRYSLDPSSLPDTTHLERYDEIAMRTPADNQASEPPSSLDDSNYELLSSSGILSDDEGNTVSVASQSIDGDTPDDFSSINDTGESEAEDEEEHLEGETPDIRNVETPSATEDDTIDESGMTATPPLSHMFTEFDVISSGDDGELLSHTLQASSDDESVVLRLAVSPEVAQLPRRFRVLIVGDLYSYAGASLLHHIAQALVLSHESTDGSSPLTVTPIPSATCPRTFQIQPSSGLEIQIDHCVEAKDVSRLILEDGSELRFFKDGNLQRITHDSVQPSELPHLAIFLHSEQQRRLQHNATMRWARVASMTNNIPTLDVAASGYFEWQELMRPNRGTELHVEIRSRGASVRNSTIYQPVDIHRLAMISPSHLNRHLAYLMWDAEESKRATNRSAPQVVQSIQIVAKAVVARLAETYADFLRYARPAAERLWTTARFEQKAAILGLIIMLILPMLLTPFFAPSGHEVIVPQTPAPPAVQNMQNSVSSALRPSSTSTNVELAPGVTQVIEAQPPLVDASIRTIIEKSLGRPQHRLDSKPEDVPDKFTAERISSSVFSITPPTFLAKSKKFSPSSVVIKVRRGSEPVPFKLMTMTKPHVGFAVELEPEDAHGLLSVLISVNSKPKIVENLTVDFGNSWLRGPRWGNAFKALHQMARQEATDFKKQMKSLSSRASADLCKLWKETEKYRAYAQRDGRKAVREALKEIKSSAKDLIWLVKKEMKVISKHIQFEMKIKKSATRKLLQQSKKFAQQTLRGADVVRREVAEALTERFSALTGMVQKKSITGSMRSSGGLKKLVENAKNAISHLAGDAAAGCSKKPHPAKTDNKQKKAKASQTTKTYGNVKSASGSFKLYETGSSFGKRECRFVCEKYDNGYIQCTETGKCPTKTKKKLLHKLGV